ncbi:hypothetical protein Barb4_02184 [Bacteroidales bacterium Barb4]|nr:hypothetical protein Barb4_02184 [Bacteroidales bacterium Barb4]
MYDFAGLSAVAGGGKGGGAGKGDGFAGAMQGMGAGELSACQALRFD